MTLDESAVDDTHSVPLADLARAQMSRADARGRCINAATLASLTALRRAAYSDEMEPAFPLPRDAFCATLTRVLMTRGQAREVALLAFGTVSISLTGHDNWDGGIDLWTVIVLLPAETYALVPRKEIELCESCIREAANEVLRAVPGHGVEAVTLAPGVVVQADWRDDAARWLAGEGITNQGRVRSDNIATRKEDGLLFRSDQEILLYRALKEKGVAFAPLPVFLHGGESYRRIEPDFVLLKDRVMMVVEVDGDTVHRETPAAADERLRMLRHEGATIERVAASECDTFDKARTSAKRLLAVIDKLKAHR